MSKNHLRDFFSQIITKFILIITYISNEIEDLLV
jgi:hypothetical protein